ncbi:MAG: hypothetical protein R3C26_22430 [Calditrichia bacterium]
MCSTSIPPPPELKSQDYRKIAMPGKPLLPVLAMPLALPEGRPGCKIVPETVENYSGNFL